MRPDQQNVVSVMSVCVPPPPLLTSILVPNREHSKYEGAERGGEISSPVIPHSKVGRRDLNTEQHPWWWLKERRGGGGGGGGKVGGGGKRRKDRERDEGIRRGREMRMDSVGRRGEG